MRKASVVIFEGPDGAGKSTAAEYRAIRERALYNASKIIHNGPPPKGITSKALYREYMDQLKVAVWRRENNVSTIIDRSFVSEVVYGPLYRGKSLLTKRQVRKLERFCTKNDIECIGIDTNLYLRLMRLEERGEEFDPKQASVGIAYRVYFLDHASWTIASGQLAHA